MKRLLLLSAVGLALSSLVASCATPAAESDVTKKHLALVVSDEKATVHKEVDIGDKGFGPGDLIVEEAPVLDSSGASVGDSFTTVTVTSGKSDQEFNGFLNCTFKLADGNIVFSGYFTTKDLATGGKIPVVGGTGAYNGALGTVTMVVPDEKKTNASFDLLLPKIAK